MTIEEFNRETPVKRVIPETCWCGGPNRQADDHICADCPTHCELEAHRAGRESPRDVELRRQLAKQGRHPHRVEQHRRSA